MISPQLPVLAVGAIVRHGDAVLLVKRGAAPSLGEWAIPGGRVHLGESLAQAAEREILEETGVIIEAGEVVYTFEYIDEKAGHVAFHYVVLDLTARYVSGEPRAGDDAAAAAWVRFAELDRLPVNRTTRSALAKLFPGEMT
jgi:ADP-ribose pyrophosphatase